MENVAISARKNFTMDKYFSQVKIVTPNNISKLLKVACRSVISSAEIVNNFLLVSGKIVANAVYLTDENKVENTETTVDFVEKQKITFIVSELSACDELVVESVSSSSSEVMLSVAHKTEIFGVYRYLLGDVNKAEENLVLNKKTIDTLSFKTANDENFVVAEEVETNLKQIKVLNINTDVFLTSSVAAVDKVILEGKAKVNALYSDETGLGEIVKDFEFKQEIAMKNALPGMSVDIVLRHLNTSIVSQEKDEKNSLAFVIDLTAKAYLYENATIETFDDLFSLTNEITPVYEYAELTQDDGFEFDNDTVLTQTDVSVNGDFDDIVGVFEPQIKILETKDLGEKMQVVAEISALAVYKTQTSIEKMDLHYETRFETEKDLNKTLKNVFASVNVSAFKVKAGKDLESAFSVEYKFAYEKTLEEKYVKTFEVLKEKENLDAGVKVYVARENQKVFDVAKALNVRPELIISQTQVDDFFEKGQKVFVYCPLNFA